MSAIGNSNWVLHHSWKWVVAASSLAAAILALWMDGASFKSWSVLTGVVLHAGRSDLALPALRVEP